MLTSASLSKLYRLHSRLRLRAGLESEAPGAWAICLHMGIHSLQRIRTLAYRGPALKYYNKHPRARDQGSLTPGLCHQAQKYLHHLTSPACHYPARISR